MVDEASPIRRGISTAQLAEALGRKAAAIRTRLCQTGSFHGIRPWKLPGGRLLWPEDAVERLIAAGGTNDGGPSEAA